MAAASFLSHIPLSRDGVNKDWKTLKPPPIVTKGSNLDLPPTRKTGRRVSVVEREKDFFAQKDKNLSAGKLFLCLKKGGPPALLMSLIPFDGNGSVAPKPVASLSGMLTPITSVPNTTVLFNSNHSQMQYDPDFLDPPDLSCGTRKKVLHMKGIIFSSIPFVKSKELKIELNNEFSNRHSDWLNPKNCLSLSKIRKVKQMMIDTIDFKDGLEEFIQVSTVSLAFAYFEKLIIKNLVTKQNRKVYGSTCLFLAFKVNLEAITTLHRQKTFRRFWSEIEHHLNVRRSSVLKSEFVVFEALNFDLCLSTEEYFPHMRQILRQHREAQDNDLEDYLLKLTSTSSGNWL